MGIGPAMIAISCNHLLAFIYVRRANAKMSYRSLWFPDYGMTNACNFKWGFTPLKGTPKGVIKKWATTLTLIYVKAPRLKKQFHSLPYSVLRILNDQCKHFMCGFTPDSNHKMGKNGVTKLVFIYVKDPRLKSLT